MAFIAQMQKHGDVIVAVSVVSVLGVMVLPIPAFILDISDTGTSGLGIRPRIMANTEPAAASAFFPVAAAMFGLYMRHKRFAARSMSDKEGARLSE